MIGKHSLRSRILWLGTMCLALGASTGCLTNSDRHLISIHHAKPKQPLEISVTGLVTQPGKQTIPLGGLTLKDAVALAGGDLPEHHFKVSPTTILVAIDRAEGVFHFSLPSVTNDLAGKIFLIPGDKVSLGPWHATDLSRATELEVNEEDEARWIPSTQALKKILPEIEKQKTPVAYSISFADFNQKPGNVRVNVDLKELKADGKVTAMSRSTARKAEAASLKFFSDPKNGFAGESEQQTVIVLRRRVEGRFVEYSLMRSEPGHLRGTKAEAEEVLKSVLPIPGDTVAINALALHPLVLTSLSAPHLFDFAKRNERHHCFGDSQHPNHERMPVLSKVKDAIQELR